MDGLSFQCDSANLRLLSRVYRNKIERKFLVLHSVKESEKSAIWCGIAKCHLVCQACLSVTKVRFSSTERALRYRVIFFYYHFSHIIVTCKPFRCIVILWILFSTFPSRVKPTHSSCFRYRSRYILVYPTFFTLCSCADHADDVNWVSWNRHDTLVAASKLCIRECLLFVMQSGIKTNG